MSARNPTRGKAKLKTSAKLGELANLREQHEADPGVGFLYGLLEPGAGQGEWDRIYMTPSLGEYVEVPPGTVVDVTDREPEDLVWVRLGEPMRHVVVGVVEVDR